MTGFGAVIGLIIGIVLIIRKFSPAYCLILAAVLGGLIGSLRPDLLVQIGWGSDWGLSACKALLQDLSINTTVKQMIAGVQDITPAILRILTAGVLAGILVKTGAAARIADSIVNGLGAKRVLPALVLAAFFLTFVGVFIDVAVITVAPVALAVGSKMNLSRMSVLLAMIGGGKSGNIISPNPNTIAAAENFNADLSAVMFENLFPALIGILASILLASWISRKGELLVPEPAENNSEDNASDANASDSTRIVSQSPKMDDSQKSTELAESTPGPTLLAALVGPVAAIGLLALRPLAGLVIDPLIALPAGGLIGLAAMRRFGQIRTCLEYGLSRMAGVAILLTGTGAVAGVIKASDLKDSILAALNWANLPEITIAPLSGAVMSAATASTTAGASVASAAFGSAILAAGISAVHAAAMVNAGATVLDHLPHGSFFHATAGATGVDLIERLKLIPYETAIGAVLAVASVFL